MKLFPFKSPIQAKISVPGSKSYTNRALMIAALTQGRVSIKNPLFCDDTNAMVQCLQTLGIQIEVKSNEILVHGDISCVEEKKYELFAYDSGTTLRFILALLCIVPGEKIIQGHLRLNERPIRDLVDALKALGGRIAYLEKEGCLPLKITSGHLSSRDIFLKTDVSSQFYSALLLIAPCMQGDVLIQSTTPFISKPYIDMTLHMMKEANIEIEKRGERGYFLQGPQVYKKMEFTIEGDFSSAAYFFAIAALNLSLITVENLNFESLQADRKFLLFLSQMGNHVSYGKNFITLEGKRLAPMDFSMEDCPDQIMTMAVLLAFAQGRSRISGIRSLRVKECDRVKAIRQELSKMGIVSEETQDILTIYGGNPKGAQVETYNDHRIAMAFAVAGTRISGMEICHPEVVNKTFPAFWDTMALL